MQRYAVVDIFAGPGGLAEGFSSVTDGEQRTAFSIVLSIEKDQSAHATLKLRSFLRQFGREYPAEYYQFLNGERGEPDWSRLFPSEWGRAQAEAWQLELGSEDPDIRLNARLDAIRTENGGNVVLIGGPPCQAYSMAGRSRNLSKEGYNAADDERHFLYEEYIRILDRLHPAAFVMENVKGMLSSSIGGDRIFDRVLNDLRADRGGGVRYRLLALTPRSKRLLDLGRSEPHAADFVIRAEDYGVPQARHRVIIVGLRNDIASRVPDAALSDLLRVHSSRATVGNVLDGMPKLRSGLSRSTDGAEEWKAAVLEAMEFVGGLDTALSDNDQIRFMLAVSRHRASLAALEKPLAREGCGIGISPDCPPFLQDWLVDPSLARLPNHVSKAHMPGDLARYFFAAVFSEIMGRSPVASEYPAELAPKHKNWATGHFSDRFRVQGSGSPSTTITSHIAKDGHYFIHPDPSQCRSLSVREAARLQTFPDNYFFKGNRTEQYVQVGNAVPPLLACWIGEALFAILSAERSDQSTFAAGARLSHVS